MLGEPPGEVIEYAHRFLEFGWQSPQSRARLLHIASVERGGNGDQTSNKEPGYAITQTGCVSAVAPR
jgi:hypothetical protein